MQVCRTGPAVLVHSFSFSIVRGSGIPHRLPFRAKIPSRGLVPCQLPKPQKHIAVVDVQTSLYRFAYIPNDVIDDCLLGTFPPDILVVRFFSERDSEFST